MTTAYVAGILVGVAISVAGFVLSWRGATHDARRAQELVETARRLAEQEKAELDALPDPRSDEQRLAVSEASERRYAAAGLDRPTWDNLVHLPHLAAAREKARAGAGTKRGILLAAFGVLVATVTAFLGP